MYTVDWAGLLSRAAVRTGPAGSGPTGPPPGLAARVSASRISPTVWRLGLTSFFTDVSSEMVSSILPMYLIVYLRLSPLAFGTIDGVYEGFAAIARLAGGFAGDRWRNHKAVASVGYGLSAVCKLAMLGAGNAWSLLALTIAVDRTGKGIRTAPRDALISLSTPHRDLAAAFAVHRALDAAGAMLGPLLAFLLFSFLPGAFDVVFVVSFCIGMIGLGVILFLVQGPARAADAVTPAAPVTMAAAMGLLRIPDFRRLSVAGGLLSLATVSDSFVFLTLQRQIAFSAAYFPLLYVGVAACHGLLAVPIGRVADRRGRRGTFLAGYVVLLAVYVVLVTPDFGPMRLIVALVLVGSYYAATDGVLEAMASAALPAPLCGSGLALLVSVTNIARLLASVVFGAIWQWIGLTTAIVVFAGGLLVALVAARMTLQPADGSIDRLKPIVP
jgi:MFS family permease